MRFALAVAGPLVGCYTGELFWHGVALLAAGSLLHLWAKGCLRQYEVLTVCGPYRWVRHPFYLAYLIIDVGLCLMIARIWVAAAYFPVWLLVYALQIRREERKLSALFGREYAAYQRRVPTLIPFGPHAPRAEGQSFSWSNPNLTRRSEVARLLRLADFPLFFFLTYRIRDAGLDYLETAGPADAFAIAALFAVFFFSKLLTPAIRRRRPLLPRWLESRVAMSLVQVAILAAALYSSVPAVWGSYPLRAGIVLAGSAFVSMLFGPLRHACLGLILGNCAIAVAWQIYWLAPIAVFYYASCAIDRKLFPKTPSPQRRRE